MITFNIILGVGTRKLRRLFDKHANSGTVAGSPRLVPIHSRSLPAVMLSGLDGVKSRHHRISLLSVLEGCDAGDAWGPLYRLPHDRCRTGSAARYPAGA